MMTTNLIDDMLSVTDMYEIPSILNHDSRYGFRARGPGWDFNLEEEFPSDFSVLKKNLPAPTNTSDLEASVITMRNQYPNRRSAVFILLNHLDAIRSAPYDPTALPSAIAELNILAIHVPYFLGMPLWRHARCCPACLSAFKHCLESYVFTLYFDDLDERIIEYNKYTTCRYINARRQQICSNLYAHKSYESLRVTSLYDVLPDICQDPIEDNADFYKRIDYVDTHESDGSHVCFGTPAWLKCLQLMHDIETNPGEVFYTVCSGVLIRLYKTGKFKGEKLLSEFEYLHSQIYQLSFARRPIRERKELLRRYDELVTSLKGKIKLVDMENDWADYIERNDFFQSTHKRLPVLDYGPVRTIAISRIHHDICMKELQHRLLYKKCAIECAVKAHRCINGLSYQMFGFSIDHKHSLSLPPEVISMAQSLSNASLDLRVYFNLPHMTDAEVKNAAIIMCMLLGASYILTEKTIFRNLMFGIGAAYGLHSMYKALLPQAGEFEAIFNIMLQGYTLGIFNKAINISSLDGFYKSLVGIRKNSEAVSDWFNAVKTWLTDITGFVCKLFGLEINNMLGLHYKILQDLSEEISVLVQAWNVDNSLPVDIAPRVLDISLRLDELHSDVVYLSKDGRNLAAVIGRITRLQASLKPMADAASRMGLASVNRVEPFHFLFTGHPGTGKSFIQIHTARQLYFQQCTARQLAAAKDKPAAAVYVKPTGSKFWSGYASHPIVVYNDLFQAKDAAGQESEATDIIQCVGDNPVPLNMNLNEEKGKVFFCAEILASNTNVEYVHKTLLASINEPIAIIRRSRIAYYVGVKPEYSKLGGTAPRMDDERFYKELDTSKIPDSDEINTEPYQFIKWDLSTGTPIGDWMSYNQMLGELQAKYAQHVKTKRENRLKKMRSNLNLISATARERGFTGFDSEVSAADMIPSNPWESININPATGMIKKDIPPILSWYDRAMLWFQSDSESVLGIIALNEYRLILHGGYPGCEDSFTKYVSQHRRFDGLQYSVVKYLASLNDTEAEYAINAVFTDQDIKAAALKSRTGLKGLIETCCDEVVSLALLIKRYLVDGLIWFLDQPIVSEILLPATVGTAVLAVIYTAVSYMWKTEDIDTGKLVNQSLSKSLLEEGGDVDFLSKRVNNNQCRVFVQSTNMRTNMVECVPRINGVWLGANYVLVNHHFYLDTVERGKKGGCLVGFMLFNERTKEPQTMYDSTTLVWKSNPALEELDLIVIEVPTGHMMPNFVKYLPSIHHRAFRSIIDNVNPRCAIFSTFRDGSKEKMHIKLKLGKALVTTDGRAHPNTLLADVMDYDDGGNKKQTINGDCGGIGYLVDDMLKDCCKDDTIYQNPVPFYFHIGIVPLIGTDRARIYESNHTYGVPLYREYFDGLKIPGILTKHDCIVQRFKMIEKAFQTQMKRDMDIPVESANNNALFEKHHRVVSEMNQLFTVTMTNDINKSSLHGLFTTLGFPPTRVPAKLYPHLLKSGKFVDPMVLARADYGSNDSLTVVTHLVERAGSYTARRILNASSDPKPRLLTFEDAVNGVPSLNLSSINRSTSAGFIGNILKKYCDINFKGKEGFFGNSELPDCDLPMAKCLKALVDDNLEKLRTGMSITQIWTDCLKGELLAKEKVAIGKARLFCAGEVDFLIMTVMYFGSFAAWILDNRIKNGIAVGMNPTSIEWTLLYNHLRNVGDNGIFGDYGKYDKRLLELFMMSAKFTIKAFYGDLYSDIHEALFAQLVISIHVVHHAGRAYFYVWNHGNTSGNFLTAILNSIVNEVIVFYCIFMIYKSTMKLDDIEALMDANVAIIVYGDDNAISVSDKIKDEVSFLTLQHQIALIGLEYTDELKSGSIVPHKPIMDGNFIARSFRIEVIGDVPVLLAPLRYVSTLEAVQWDKRADSVLTKRQTVDTTFKELRRHGKTVFDMLAPALAHESWIKLSYRSPYSDWIVARDTYWESFTPKFSFETTGEVLDCTPWSPNESIVVGLDNLQLLKTVF